MSIIQSQHLDHDPYFIALIGGMHVGKTTFADHLCKNYGYTRISFADEVKISGALMLRTFAQHVGISHEEIDYQYIQEHKNHPDIRAFLQFIGTSLGRSWSGNENIWIDLMRTKFIEARKRTTRIVIDDCRFANEGELLKELGFNIILLNRNGPNRLASIRKGIELQHPGLNPIEIGRILDSILQHPSEQWWMEADPDTIIWLEQNGTEKACYDYCKKYNISQWG